MRGVCGKVFERAVVQRTHLFQPTGTKLWHAPSTKYVPKARMKPGAAAMLVELPAEVWLEALFCGWMLGAGALGGIDGADVACCTGAGVVVGALVGGTVVGCWYGPLLEKGGPSSRPPAGNVSKGCPAARAAKAANKIAVRAIKNNGTHSGGKQWHAGTS